MPKISLKVSPDITARVGAIQQRLSSENGENCSPEGMLGELIVIGLDRIAKNEGEFPPHFRPPKIKLHGAGM
jgi:hypothetical protein